MKDLPRPILRDLVQRYGDSIARDPLRCEALLRDTCGSCGREIFVLVNAVRQHVPLDLLAPRHNLPLSLMKGFMIKRLQDELGLSDESARWSVETWAYALSLAESPEEINGASGSEKKPGIPEENTGRRVPANPAMLKRMAENLESGDTSRGLAAIRELASAGDDASIRLITAALAHSRWKVRSLAYETLVSLSLESVPALVEMLKNPEEVQVSRAVLVLAAIRSRAATEPLCALLGRSRSLDLVVIFALGEIGDPGAVPALSRGLATADPDMGLALAGALRRLSGTGSAPS